MTIRQSTQDKQSDEDRKKMTFDPLALGALSVHDFCVQGRRRLTVVKTRDVISLFCVNE